MRLPRWITPLALGPVAEGTPAVIVEATDQLEVRISAQGADLTQPLGPLAACRLGQALQEASAWVGQQRAQRRRRA